MADGERRTNEGERTIVCDIISGCGVFNGRQRLLPDGTYTLLIEKDGYLAKKLGPIDATQKDQNLGDIVLWKA